MKQAYFHALYAISPAALLAILIILIGCSDVPSSHVSAIRDNGFLLGLYPVDITGTGTADHEAKKGQFNLLVCPVYTDEFIKRDCVPALVTKSNRPVVFTTVYPEISERLGNKEFYAMLVPTVATPLLIAKILRSRNLKVPNLSPSELNQLMKRSNRIIAGVSAVSVATIALLYLFEKHVWGADTRELARLQQDIFTETDFRNVSKFTRTNRSIHDLLELLASNLDLQVSREAKLLLTSRKRHTDTKKLFKIIGGAGIKENP